MLAAEAPTLIIPTSSRDFASLAALAIELAAHHGDKHAQHHLIWSAIMENGMRRGYHTAGGQDVGFVTWQRFYVSECAERSMEIRNLFVKEDARGRGIGRELIRAAAHAALAADCQRVRLSVRKDNGVGVRFYRQLGGAGFDMGMSRGYRWSRDGMLGLAEGTWALSQHEKGAKEAFCQLSPAALCERYASSGLPIAAKVLGQR